MPNLSAYAYRRRHIQCGLCGYCTRKAAPGLTRCEMHRRKDQNVRKKNRPKRIDAGRCVTCGRPLTETDSMLVTCRDCIELGNKRRRSYL
jgi:hypothetical protein